MQHQAALEHATVAAKRQAATRAELALAAASERFEDMKQILCELREACKHMAFIPALLLQVHGATFHAADEYEKALALQYARGVFLSASSRLCVQEADCADAGTVHNCVTVRALSCKAIS